MLGFVTPDIVYCRIFQTGMRAASYLLPWRTPWVVRSGAALAADLRDHGHERVLLVTDPGLVKAGIAGAVAGDLTARGLTVTVDDAVAPGPTVDDVAHGVGLFRSGACTAIVAVGGGSPMDCAKAIGAQVARPGRSIAQLRGLLKVRRGVPYLAAVPTTAGTGSETTVAAVISDPATHEKGPINDPALIPRVALLDPGYTVGVPPLITAATGMDALSHAVEAYIGRANTRTTRREALVATRLVFEHLRTVVADGSNLAARAKMQEAAFRAGVAFTRAYVGYVHAASHQLSGRYGTIHGLANAVLMPHVLEMFGTRAHRRLAELADVAGIGAGLPRAQQAAAFIEALRRLSDDVGLPRTIDALAAADIPDLAGRAVAEGNPLYPVPRIFTRADFEDLYHRVLPGD